MTGKKNINLLAQIPEIVSLIKNGYTLDEIAQQVGENKLVIASYLKYTGNPFREVRKQAIYESLKEVENGNEYLFRVRQKFRLAPTSFYGFMSKLDNLEIFNQEAPLNPSARKELEQLLQSDGNPLVNKRILEGKDICEIGKEFNFTRQEADMYIRGSGAYTLWKELRDNIRKEKSHIDLNEKREEFLSFLREYALQRTKISEGDSPETKAEKTFARKRLTSFNQGHKSSGDQRILRLFKEYFLAQEKGEKLSFKELSIRAGYSSQSDYKIGISAKVHLNKVGLQSLNWSISPLTSEQIKTIKRGRKTNFTAEDLIYFAGTNATRTIIFRQVSLKHHKHNPLVIHYPKEIRVGIKQGLSYSELSQIYEAIDRKFNRSELPILFPRLYEESIDKAISERSIHEPAIIEGLRILYPHQDIQHPYTNLGGSFKKSKSRRN